LTKEKNVVISEQYGTKPLLAHLNQHGHSC